jgi:CO dehydrogenase nickel-insertion accessory protein CooC1
MAFVLCVGTPKGGSGKTTLSILLGLAYAEIGYSVTILDTDPQGLALQWFAKVSLVMEHQGEYSSQWQAERDAGTRAGQTTDERERIKALERENCELRQANEILPRRALEVEFYRKRA